MSFPAHVDHPIRFGYLLHMVRVEASADCLTRVWGLTMDVRAYLRADAENRWVTVLDSSLNLVAACR